MITTDIDYPDYLPVPTKQGYSRKTVSPVERTQMRNGRARMRRTYSSVPAEYDVTWIFRTGAEAALFESFFKRQLKEGTEWFNCPMRTPLGTGMYVCRFMDIYEGPDMFGACGWQVRAQLEMYERPLISEEYAQFPEYIINADILDKAANVHWPRKY